MSYAASITSTTGSIATYARKIAHHGRPDVEILLDNHSEGKVYTTFDALAGKVNVTAPHSARFDEIKITLEGNTKTYVENLSAHSSRSRTNTTHNFLKLVMPVRESDYPQPRIAEAGTTYTFPFNFVIPDQLLPRACSHQCTSEHVHQAHIQLPPSLGDRDVTPLDDLAPEMAKITYSIKAKVIRNRESDAKEVVLVDGTRKLHVIPAIPEAPPVSTGDGFDEYVLSKTKTLKKGMFSGKLGKITVTAAQTHAFMHPAPSPGSHPAATLATLHLRFDPAAAGAEPPRLGGLTSKIRSSTHFAARPAASLPMRPSTMSHFEAQRGVYVASTPLSSRCVEAVAWHLQRGGAPPADRRSSDSSTCSDSSGSEAAAPGEGGGGEPYYTARVLVPLLLPASRAWPPTFHSCVVSRIYTLTLTLTIHTPSASVPASTVTLHLPVQVGAEGNVSERAPMTEAELVDAEGFFVPRVRMVAEGEVLGESVLLRGGGVRRESETDEASESERGASELPPSYEDFEAVPRTVEPGRS